MTPVHKHTGTPPARSSPFHPAPSRCRRGRKCTQQQCCRGRHPWAGPSSFPAGARLWGLWGAVAGADQGADTGWVPGVQPTLIIYRLVDNCVILQAAFDKTHHACLSSTSQRSKSAMPLLMLLLVWTTLAACSGGTPQVGSSLTGSISPAGLQAEKSCICLLAYPALSRC